MQPLDSNFDFAPAASLIALQRRAELLRQLREFFHTRKFIEVETPLLASEVIPELYIEPIAVAPSPTDSRWLQASPELHMKRLLAAGARAIFQVTRSFRADERGRLHNPEFTMVEWYRAGDDMEAGMDLLDDLAQTLFGTPPARRTTYAAAFQQYVGLSPHTATTDVLAAAAKSRGIRVPDGMDEADRDEWLNLLLATLVEPQLGRDRPEILYHYPATQAALAQIGRTEAGGEVAERFELYYRGVELANGYHELADALELRERFAAVNSARVADGRAALPMPERLLAALEHGQPDCTGVALGFDRLVMLSIGATSIDEVIAFPQEYA